MKTKPSSNRATSKVKRGRVLDKAQYERFREFAREVEADDDPKAFDRKFRQIVPPKSGRN